MSVIRSIASTAGRQRGFTLVEVLVALIVLAIGLLGLAQLQARGLKFNQDAYVRSQATTLAYEIIDRMRSNRASGIGYVSNTITDPPPYIPPAPVVRPTGTCTPTTSSTDMDLICWYAHIEGTLPAGAGRIVQQPALPSGDPSPYYDITLTWNDRETATTKAQTWTTWP